KRDGSELLEAAADQKCSGRKRHSMDLQQCGKCERNESDDHTESGDRRDSKGAVFDHCRRPQRHVRTLICTVTSSLPLQKGGAPMAKHPAEKVPKPRQPTRRSWACGA